jgi:hypothetical protein
VLTLENSSTIDLVRLVSRETRLLFIQFAQKLSKKCLASPSSAALLRRRGDGSFPNYLLGPPEAMHIVVTSYLAYCSTIFIDLDELHPSSSL